MASDEGSSTCVDMDAVIELLDITLVSLIISSNDSIEKVTDKINSDSGNKLNPLKSKRSAPGRSSISLIENPSKPVKLKISIPSNVLDSVVIIF